MIRHITFVVFKQQNFVLYEYLQKGLLCENNKIVNENNNEEKTKLKINLIMYKIFFIYMYITFKVWKTTKQNIIKY